MCSSTWRHPLLPLPLDPISNRWSVKQFDGDPAMPLLWYLHDLLELTVAKFGCGMGLCGACAVHVEGKAIRSCVTNMGDVAGKRITRRRRHRIQPAPGAHRAASGSDCGVCSRHRPIPRFAAGFDQPGRRAQHRLHPADAARHAMVHLI
jgi:xanthine dehydrogenase iron-sulfur cluster and FAD-binding subunit A